MISILDKSSMKVNIYIIHKIEEDSSFLPLPIKEHSSLNDCKVYKFDRENTFFPNLDNAHVSEATYYRIFLDQYLPNDIETIIYIDSDIICQKDLGPILMDYVIKLKKSKYLLGAKTEWHREDQHIEIFNRLKMNSDNYLNAGVLLINLDKWKKEKIRDKILNILNNLDFELNLWDQDLFNHFFDGRYLELDSVLNWNLDITLENHTNNDPILVHFYGKEKPWVGRGLFTKNSEIFQKEYRKISTKKYFIEHRWIPTSLKFLVNSFFNGSFFQIKYKFRFINEFIKSIYLKKKSDL